MNAKRLLVRVLFFAVLCLVKQRTGYPVQPHDFLDEDIDFSSIFSDLPTGFDLSTATTQSLRKLPYFTVDSAQRVVAFRDSLSMNYLQDHSDEIPGLSPMEHAVLIHLISMYKTSVPSRFSGFFRQGLIHNLGEEVIAESKYFTKIQAEYKGVGTINIIGERDRFEPKAFDLYSINAKILLDRGRTNLLAGDFRPGFGQGLLFSRYGRIYGNGTGIMQRDAANTANTSFEETRFLRGAFLSVRRKKITTQTWLSLRHLDATIDDDGNAVTIRDTGNHISGAPAGNLTEKLFGSRCIVSPVEGLSFAVAGMVSRYSPEMSRKDGEQYYFDPEGSVFRYLTADGTFRRGPAVLFFEHALMNRSETGSVGGITVKKPSIQGSAVIRRYGKGYWSPRAGSYSSFGSTSNEKGVYSSISLNLPGKTAILASMDLARMLYRTTASPLPLSRRRFNIVLKSSRKKGYTVWLGYRSTDDNEISSHRWNVRCGVEKRFKGYNGMRWRSGFVWSGAGGDSGPAAETSLLAGSGQFRFNITGCLFDIPAYSARLYRYEHDVPGRGYMRAVWGHGGTVIAVAGRGPLSVRYRYSDSDIMDMSRQITMQFDTVF